MECSDGYISVKLVNHRNIAVSLSRLFHFISKVRTVGIEEITPEIVETGRKNGCETKLIGAAELHEDGIHITCEPMYVKKECPLSFVSGVYNAVLVKGEASGAGES